MIVLFEIASEIRDYTDYVYDLNHKDFICAGEKLSPAHKVE